MRKIKFMCVAVVAVMGLAVGACASSGSEKADAETTTSDNASGAVEATGEPAQGVSVIENPEDSVVKYNGKFWDIPEFATNLSPESAKATGHPTFILFGASSNKTSEAMKGFVEGLIGKYEGKIEFIYVDTDKTAKFFDFAKNFGIEKSGIPTIVVVDHNGNFDKYTTVDEVKAKIENRIKTVIEK